MLVVATLIPILDQPSAEAATPTIVVTDPDLPYSKQWASPAGVLLVANSNNDGSRNLLRAFGSTGDLRFSLTLDGLIADITFSPSGDIFIADSFLEDGDYRVRIRHVSPTGGLIGSAVLDRKYYGATGIEFGADGRLFVGVGYENSSRAIVALNPTNLSITQTVGVPYNWEFAARPSGLVTYGPDNATYLDYRHLAAPVSMPLGDPASQTYQWSIAPDSSVYQLRLDIDDGVGYPCANAGVSHRTINGIGWKREVSAYLTGQDLFGCRVVDIEALPSSEAVVTLVRQKQVMLLWIGSDGTLTRRINHTFPFGGTDRPLGYNELFPRLVDSTVDGNGNVVVATTYPDRGCPAPESIQHQCSTIEVSGFDANGLSAFTQTIPTAGDYGPSVQLDYKSYIQDQELELTNALLAFPVYLKGQYFCGQTCWADGSTSAQVIMQVPVARRWWDNPPTTQSSPSPTPDVFKYVALGDSYSSGEGVDPYFRDGWTTRKGIMSQPGNVDNGCHRSTRAYAEYVRRPGDQTSIYSQASGGGKPGTDKQVVNKYGSDQNVRLGKDVEWGFFACSGAKIENVKKAMDGGKVQEPSNRYKELFSQLDYTFIDSDTDLVTITIGGNDVGFADILKTCYKHACAAAKYAGYRQEVYTRIDQMSGQLEQLYRSIRQTVRPGTQVIVLGYPMIMPASVGEQGCKSLIPFRGEFTFLRDMNVRVNAQIQKAANGAGVTFLDMTAAFMHHEVCGEDGEWLNGPSVTSKPNRWFTDDEAFHPNLKGQQEYAARINAYLLSQARLG